MSWTPERIEQLKKLHAENNSYSYIAMALGGVSRNAVCGKIHRLGLAMPQAPAAPRPIQRGVPAAPRALKRPMPKGVMVLPPLKGGSYTEKAAAARQANVEARQQPAENVLQMASAFVPLPGCAPVPFGHGGCKWPCGGEGADALQCGQPRSETDRGVQPYCEAHSRAAYQAVKKGQPKSGNELARSLRRYISPRAA